MHIARAVQFAHPHSTYLITQGADTRNRIKESKTAAKFRLFVDGLRRQHRLVSMYMQERIGGDVRLLF